MSGLGTESAPTLFDDQPLAEWVDPRPVIAVVTAQEKLSECVERITLELSLDPILGVDIETTSLHPNASGRMRLIQLATRAGTYVFDLDLCPDVRELQHLVIASPALKLAHNAGFEATWITSEWGEPPRGLHCTRAAFLALRAAKTGRKDRKGSRLVDLAETVLGRTLDKSDQASDWSGDLSEHQLTYAATDASVLLSLWDVLGPNLERSAVPADAYTTVPA